MTQEFLVDHYFAWRSSRISKLEKLFGRAFFKDKSLLELACGHGHIGEHFSKLGADVTFADGRQILLDIVKQNQGTVKTILIDQDMPWSLPWSFDIIIHWGVLYHLDNWKADLKTALQYTDLMFLESEVADSDDPDFEIKVDESEASDQALHRKGSRPTASMIERHLIGIGAEFTRYDDIDLNADFHRYDWEVSNSKTWDHGLRRFWVVSAHKERK
jgi:hypothetical protein